MKKCLFLVLAFHCYIFASETFDFEAESNKVVNAYLKDMKKKEKINCSGSGGGSRGEINTISLYWNSNRVVKIDEARRMLVFAAEELFTRFNENRQLRPYFHNYPFGVESVDLHIGFNKNIKDPKQVEYVSLGNNRIHYDDFDGNLLCDECGETYQEALDICKKQNILKCKN